MKFYFLSRELHDHEHCRSRSNIKDVPLQCRCNASLVVACSANKKQQSPDDSPQQSSGEWKVTTIGVTMSGHDCASNIVMLQVELGYDWCYSLQLSTSGVGYHNIAIVALWMTSLCLLYRKQCRIWQRQGSGRLCATWIWCLPCWEALLVRLCTIKGVAKSLIVHQYHNIIQGPKLGEILSYCTNPVWVKSSQNSVTATDLSVTRSTMLVSLRPYYRLKCQAMSLSLSLVRTCPLPIVLSWGSSLVFIYSWN